MNLNLLLKQDENRPGDGMRSLQLLPYAYADNVSGFGPVVNADVYNSMIAESPWYQITATPQDQILAAQTGGKKGYVRTPLSEVRNPYNYMYKDAYNIGLLGGPVERSKDISMIDTEKGPISVNDLNVITKLGIPAEYTEVFTQEKLPNNFTENQYVANLLGAAGPVADAEEYEDIKKRADKTAKKNLTFRDLVLKSKGIE
jgi:hypothetical protein